jgi:hypothetical protein
MNERSNHSESRSKHRIQARADAKISSPPRGRHRTQHRLAGRNSSTDQFNYIEKEGERVKENRSVRGGLQDVGRHRHRHLQTPAVAHNA